MLVKKSKDIKSIIAVDGTILKELIRSSRLTIAGAVVKQKQTTKKHKLQYEEIYIITQGKGIMNIDEKEKEVDVIYIPPNSAQYIKNTGKKELKFYCIVSPPWNKSIDESLE